MGGAQGPRAEPEVDPADEPGTGSRAEPLGLVLVCGGERCVGGTDETLDALRVLVRSAPHAVLMRTACQSTCRYERGGCEVLVQRAHPDLRPIGAGRRVPSGSVRERRAEVARFLFA